MKLSIVIPAYNEEARLGNMLADYTKYFSGKYGEDMEMIIVVNGSRDRTAEIAEEWAEKFPQIRVIVEPSPIGKGGAVIRGFEVARGEFVGFVDADAATPPEAYQDLVEHIGDAGAIIASRWLKESKVSPKQPASRLVASRVFNALIRLLFGLKIHDTQCGAKLMRNDAVRKVMPELGLTRWAFDVDLLFQLRRSGYEVIERPTTWRDVEGSRLQVVRVSIEMFLAICRLRLIYSPFNWVVKAYDVTLGPIIHLRERT